MVSKAFLEKLLLKLKTGDARSIHLNALPGRFARLDLHDLIYIDQSLHLRFLRQLLSRKNFELTISIDYKTLDRKPPEYAATARTIARKLDSLHYQHQDEFLEHGTRTFAFGYPLLIKRDAGRPERILKAPLITWYLDIRKDLHQANTWHIRRSEDHPVIFNEVLRSHLETYDRILVDDLLPLFEEEILTEHDLTEIAKAMLEKLGTTSTDQDTELKVLPGTNRETIEKLTGGDPWIRWSGIFGLYKAQKQSIIRDLEALVRSEQLPSLRPVPLADTESSAGYSEVFPAVPIDPSQESILNGVRNFGNILIQGPPGTGKSQSITAVVTDNLYRGKNCLVVCEKKTALDVIHRNLEEVGLGELCISIDDIHRDRKKVVDRVRQCLDERDTPSLDFREYDHDELRTKRRERTDRVISLLHVLNTRCFGDDTLTDIVAKLQRIRERNDAVPGGTDTLPPRNSWGYEDYRGLREMIHRAEDRFNGLPPDPALDKLRDRLFTASIPGAEVYGHFTSQLNWISEIKTAFASHSGTDGLYDLFNRRTRMNNLLISIGRWVSPAVKRIHQDRIAMLTAYDRLLEEHQRCDYFDFELPDEKDAGKFDELLPALEEYGKLLEKLLGHRGHYDLYTGWRQFLCGLDREDRKLAEAFARSVETGRWASALDAWYWNSFLEHRFEKAGIKGSLDIDLNELDRLDTAMVREVSDSILAGWSARQRNLYNDRTVNHIKQLYNYRRNKKFGKRNSLRTMVHGDLELFAGTFPVVLVNPAVCSSVLPLEPGSFDTVIFDEASQLRIEDTFTALIRGKTRIISGDRHQMPPSGYFTPQVIFVDDALPDDEDAATGPDFLADSDSLLEFGMDTNFRPEYLDFHYRSRHPDLIAFSNAAFYGNRLIPMPPKQGKPPISFYQVNGVYDRNRTNIEEARAIVEHVYGAVRPADGVYPSVGIATFNIHQRDLIWDLLMEATYGDEGSARQRAHHLDRLLESGLFVKNLENIQGDERDVILISTTFGPGGDGAFRQIFGPLTRDNGYRLLNVIISRAKYRLAVFTSVPEPVRAGFVEELALKGNTGKGIFYAYLAYAKAVSGDDRPRVGTILETLAVHCRERQFQREWQSLPLFHQQLFTLLGERCTAENVVHNFRFGGFLLELAVLNSAGDAKPAVAVMTSYTRHPEHMGYRLCLFKRKMLEGHDIPVVFIDAAAWHLDRDSEEKKLLEAVDRCLGSGEQD